MAAPSDVLDNIFSRFASKSDEARNQAAEDLRTQVTSYTQEFAGHDGSKEIWGDVFHRTFDLTRSNTMYERLGATKAIGEWNGRSEKGTRR